MNSDKLSNETNQSFSMWISRGFTLHTTSSGNHYLLMEFAESVFMVRDAVSTSQVPSCTGKFKVHARSRDLCQMVGEPREVSGVDALKALIESWRNELFRPVAHVHVHCGLAARQIWGGHMLSK
ncbi:hypothetical protein [Pseudomonas sp. EMN2]|uniref:hypothetical protein n=1 Tax=Pseudomonas sp. EMN2 TaxID=2615212 RepID=UPI00129B6FF5|nr:hypothetical protein [Pseudomonas sp. EMN2]